MDNKMLNYFYENNVKMSREHTKQAIRVVMPVVHDILRCVHKYDCRFKTQPLNVGSYYSNLKVSKADEFDYSVVMDVPSSSWQYSNNDTDMSRLISLFNLTIVQNNPPETLAPPTVRPSATGTPRYTGTVSQQGTTSRESTYQYSRDTVDAFKAIGIPLHPPTMEQCVFLTDYGNVVVSTWSELGLDRGEASLTSGELIMPIKVKKRFISLVARAISELNLHSSVHISLMSRSPATTITLVNLPEIHHSINIDLCPLVESGAPFQVQYNWPRYEARWPSQAIVEQIRMRGINMIAKHPVYWTISFSHCEKILLEGIDKNGTCRKKSGRILKRIREQFLCKGAKPALTSYHLKNILFWECEGYPEDSDWSQDNLCTRVSSMCRRLVEAIQGKSLPLYFLTVVNLFAFAVKDPVDLDYIGERIKRILRYPKQFFEV